MNRVGTIHGADWVMPDGSIVAQAVELLNDDTIVLRESRRRYTSFYADIDDYTFMLDIYMWGWSEEFYEIGISN